MVDLNWVRGPQYTQYFDFLDHKAGWFFYRWGDALVRTLAIHMFLEPEEVERLSWICTSVHVCHCDRAAYA